MTIGQYFALVNEDRKERVGLPGGMKAIERVCNPVAMGMIGYLLLDGPQDGTAFLYRGENDVPDEEVEAYIDRERQIEVENDSTSSMRTDDDAWDRETIKRIVAAGYEINDANEYAGRWAGDRVRLVGDYAENDLYTAAEGRVVAQLDDGSMISWEAYPPRRAEPGGRSPTGAGQTVRIFQEDAEPGDTIQISNSVDIDDEFATFVRYEENEWTIINDELYDEFADFVGHDWLETNGYGDLV